MVRGLDWLKSEIWGIKRNLGMNWKEEVLDIVDQVEYIGEERQVERNGESEYPDIPKYMEEYIHYCRGRGFTLIGAFKILESGYKENNKEDFEKVNMYFIGSNNQYNFAKAYKYFEEIKS